jgi:hypothetical protein
MPNELEGPAKWSAALEKQRDRGQSLELDPQRFAQEMDEPWPNERMQAWLDQCVAAKELNLVEAFTCPNEGCGQLLNSAQVADGQCPNCHIEFAELGQEPQPVSRYRIAGLPSRDVHWMVIVHGMNTRGPWQEELSWRIANKFRYHAPVLIYKYGWTTIDVLAPLIQQGLAKELGRKIRSAVQYAAKSGIADPPDLVAHSFGTLLFSLLLRDREFDDLKFGRVITVGSIVRPDFDWGPYLEAGRIEAVLNHTAGKDIPVRVAQYIIPGSGPGGYVGYLDLTVTNVMSNDFVHSSALEEQQQSVLLANGGLWDRFLRYPQAGFRDVGQFRPSEWKRASAITRCFGKGVGIAIFALALVPSGIRRLFDR